MFTPAKSVLINTKNNDLHTKVVSKLLTETGCSVTLYQGQILAQNTALTFGFDAQSSALSYHSELGIIPLSDIDVVWHRRPQRPVVPEFIVAEDKMFVQQELNSANQACLALLEDAFWLNPLDAARKADLKPVQLAIAKKVGLAVPKTLISNDPKAIKAFLSGDKTYIYKPLNAFVWYEQGKNYATYTAKVTLDNLPKTDLLRASPGIFQQLVPKQYEVRAQFFGRSCFAVSIDSNRLKYGELDWRLYQHQGTFSEPLILPEAIYLACCAMMDELGIVSGAFDFIVTPDNNWVFLEVNEAGQFLFIEQWCPELPVLDAFCRFMLSADKNFIYQKNIQPRRLVDLCSDYQLSLQPNTA